MSQNKYGGAVSGEKASIKLLTGYGLGEVACQMSWYMINNYLVHDQQLPEYFLH